MTFRAKLVKLFFRLALGLSGAVAVATLPGLSTREPSESSHGGGGGGGGFRK